MRESLHKDRFLFLKIILIFKNKKNKKIRKLTNVFYSKNHKIYTKKSTFWNEATHFIFFNSHIAETLERKLSNEAVLDWSKTPQSNTTDDSITYRVEFIVDSNFGVPGAITVSNQYQDEFFLESITFEGFVHFSCNSWVQPHQVINNQKRIFFANKV